MKLVTLRIKLRLNGIGRSHDPLLVRLVCEAVLHETHPVKDTLTKMAIGNLELTFFRTELVYRPFQKSKSREFVRMDTYQTQTVPIAKEFYLVRAVSIEGKRVRNRLHVVWGAR